MFFILSTVFVKLTNPDAVRQLFSNITWSTGVAATNEEDEMLLRSWHGHHGSVFLSLTLFVVVRVGSAAVSALIHNTAADDGLWIYADRTSSALHALAFNSQSHLLT